MLCPRKWPFLIYSNVKTQVGINNQILLTENLKEVQLLCYKIQAEDMMNTGFRANKK